MRIHSETSFTRPIFVIELKDITFLNTYSESLIKEDSEYTLEYFLHYSGGGFSFFCVFGFRF